MRETDRQFKEYIYLEFGFDPDLVEPISYVVYGGGVVDGDKLMEFAVRDIVYRAKSGEITVAGRL